ncbi:MAG: hypothetical protein ITG02_07810 [Patulibacter sp.]|nr:hypothetical protein [Patulibacter sp.]
MPRAARRAAWGLALTAATVGLAGCGGDPTGEQAYDTKVAVYVGVPLGGPWGDAGQAITRGAVLGLADSKGGAGDFSVRLSLRDVTDDDDLQTVGIQGASREAGNALRDVGAVGVVGGLDPTASRQLQLLGNQTGLGYVSASGDQIAASADDLSPRQRRMAVQLGAPDAAVATAIVGRARAADCRRTTLVSVPDAGVGSALVASELDPATTLRASSFRDSELATDLARALRANSDCVVVAGQPSGGDPYDLLEPLTNELADVTLILSRGAASPRTARLVRAADLTAEAVVDEAAADATDETRAIDAKHREIYGTPAPVGVMAGWRGIKLMLRAIADAGPGGNRRDAVSEALVAAPVPGPPTDATQNDDGTITPVAVSLARAEPYGWRAIRALDSPQR